MRFPTAGVYRPVAAAQKSYEEIVGLCQGDPHAAKLHRPVLGPNYLGAEALLADMGISGDDGNKYQCAH